MDNNLDGRIKDVAERIRTLREIVGMSLEELAEKTSVTVEKIEKIEKGESDFSFSFICLCARDSAWMLRTFWKDRVLPCRAMSLLVRVRV